MINYKTYTSVSQLPDAWDALTSHDIFLQRHYLITLETSSPTNISSYFIGVYNSNTLVGVAIIQRVQMYLDDIFRRTSNNVLKHFIKQTVARIVRGNALIVGNLMHTGQHAIYYNNQEISQDDYLASLYAAIEQVSLEIKRNFNKKIRIIAFKDFFEEDNIHKSLPYFKKKHFYQVQVQPNMIFNILNEWKSTKDYINSFTKKYRQRYKAALKKSNSLDYRELDLIFLKDNLNEVYKLYRCVSDKARVNSFILNKPHFLTLKEQLRERFKVFGFFEGNKLIGFHSIILNNDTLETYFLGYDNEYQRKHQLYLNMLYKMASFAIDNNFKQVVYARTAMEIKSSIGARPYKMSIYMKHTNNFIANTILKIIVKYMNPVRKWQERHPFKV